VEGGLGLLADEGVDLLVALNPRSRLDLAATKAIESRTQARISSQSSDRDM